MHRTGLAEGISQRSQICEVVGVLGSSTFLNVVGLVRGDVSKDTDIERFSF